MTTDRNGASMSRDNPSWTDKAAVVLGLVALIVSGIALLGSCNANSIAQESNVLAGEANDFAREANTLARQSKSFTETEVARSHIPAMHFGYFIATSPDLSSDEDAEDLRTLGFTARPLRSAYWRAALADYTVLTEDRYAFIFIMNYGPGSLSDLGIRIAWTPVAGSSPPEGVVPEQSSFGILPPRELYALLIDVLPSYIAFLDLANQPAKHFDSVTIDISYSDDSGRPYTDRLELSGLPPVLMMAPE